MEGIGKFGYIRTAAAAPKVELGNCEANAERISAFIGQAVRSRAALIVFPELSVTGYTCGDLFYQDTLLISAEKALKRIAAATKGTGTAAIVGVPVAYRDRIFNCAAVVFNGKIAGIVPKRHIPNYGEFYEGRWFSPGEGTEGLVDYAGQKGIPFGTKSLFRLGDALIGIEICEDLWAPLPPSTILCMAGANVIANLSASNELAGKHDYRMQLISQQSGRCMASYIYASAGFGESTSDLVYAGDTVIAENGRITAEGRRFDKDGTMIFSDIDLGLLTSMRRKTGTFPGFEPGTEYLAKGIGVIDLGTPAFPDELSRKIDTHPFIPSPELADKRMEEIIGIQTAALATRIDRIKSKTAVIGISGGLDSTLALLITALTYDYLGKDRKEIIGITMPGPGTTGRTKGNAVELMEVLGITSREIPISAATEQHFSDIGLGSGYRGTAYENSQARERTQILMDMANLTGGIVIGTGDLSESALGWCTYNGDHMSMYNLNGGIPKTLVRHIVKWIADNRVSGMSAIRKAGSDDRAEEARDAKAIIYDIIDTPISPELLPADEKGGISQKTEELIGPYELHDFFLYHLIRLGEEPRKILFTAAHAFKGKYDTATIEKWLGTFLKRFFSQQFKRNCMPDSPKVGTVALSPRGDWRMPSDADPQEWLGADTIRDFS